MSAARPLRGGPVASAIADRPERPTRFVDRTLRADAERAVHDGIAQLAGVALDFEGDRAADTPANARALVQQIDGAVASILKARRFLFQRGGC